MKRITDTIAYIFATLIILFAVILTVLRLMTPWFAEQKTYFETWASQVMQVPVHIAKVTATWHRLDPELRFADVTVFDPQNHQPLVHLNHLDVSINLLSSLLHKQLLPSELFISGFNLTVEQSADNQFSIRGMPKTSASSNFDVKRLGNWLLTEANVEIDDFSLTWQVAQQKPILIDNITLLIDNREQHRLIGSMFLKQANPSAIAFNMQLKQFNLVTNNYDGNVYVHIENLQPQEFLANPLFKKLHPKLHWFAGSVTGEGWAEIQQNQISHWQTKFNVDNVILSLPQIKQRFVVSSMQGLLEGMQTDKQWQNFFRLDKFNLNKIDLSGTSGALQKTTSNGDHQWLFNINYLDVANLDALAQQFIKSDSKWQTLYHELRAQGILKNVAVSYQTQAGQLPTWSAMLNFEDVQTHSWNNYPGVVNFQGRLFVNPTSGWIEINNKDQSSLFFPKAFSHTFDPTQLYALAHWQKNAAGWTISVQPLVYLDKHFWGDITTQLQAAPHQSPIINLTGQLKLNTTAATGHYLPDRILSQNLVGWLSRAFPQGYSDNATIVLHGPLKKFPFAKQEGHFEIDADIKHLNFDYYQHWPIIHNMEVGVKFINQGMYAKAYSGTVYGDHIQNVTGTIANLNEGLLHLNGDMSGDASGALAYLVNTPLSIGKQFKPLQMSGPMQLTLGLIMHLRSKEPAQVTGQLKIVNVNLTLKAWNAYLHQMKGALKFTQNSITGQNISALYYDDPIKLDVMTVGDHAQRHVEVKMQGNMSATTLAKQFNYNFGDKVTGQLSYQALLKLYDGANAKSNEYDFSSDLQGIKINAEPFYSKATTTLLPAQLHLEIAPQNTIKIKTTVGDKLSVAAQAVKDEQHFKLFNAVVHYNLPPANYAHDAGLFVGVHIPQLDQATIDDWRSKLPTDKHMTGFASQLDLKHVALSVDHLQLMNFLFADQSMTVTPQSSYWQLDFSGPQLAGTVLLPKKVEARTTLSANLSRLLLQTVKDKPALTASLKSIRANTFPQLKINIDEFDFDKYKFGMLNLHAYPVKNGLKIEELKTQNNNFLLELEGEWLQSYGDETTISGTFETHDIGQQLDAWQLTQALAGGEGSISFDIKWPANPWGFTKQNITGQIAIALNNGRILHLSQSAESEIGIGKFLNLFSLQSLPQHLFSHFSDLSQKGFAYDYMRGSLTLHDGKAYTRDAELNGSVANIQAQGMIDFVKEYYDLSLRVSPYITSSLPVIATIAGGPIAGAVTWVANKIIGPQVGRAVGFVYKVTGSWQKPQVVKLPEPR